MLASLAPQNAPDVDILVINLESKIVATLQVKTRISGVGWTMSQKHESIVDPRLLYAFVDIAPQEPVVYVIPSHVVADVLTKSHRAWHSTPGRNGQPHGDTAMRKLQGHYRDRWPGYSEDWLEEYRERWDLIRQAEGRDIRDRPAPTGHGP